MEACYNAIGGPERKKLILPNCRLLLPHNRNWANVRCRGLENLYLFVIAVCDTAIHETFVSRGIILLMDPNQWVSEANNGRWIARPNLAMTL